MSPQPSEEDEQGWPISRSANKAGVQWVDAERERIRSVEVDGHPPHGVLRHVRYEGGFDERDPARSGTVACVAGEEGETTQQLVDDIAGFGELQVYVVAAQA